jgi:UDP-4-amino-4,6-dideoxy-N-acetyl-beta-L-altrosamine transaminase
MRKEEKMIQNKIIPYGKQTITQDDIDAVVTVLQSPYITQGPKIPEFEQIVASYHGAKYGVAFCNGTAALHGAYAAIGIEEGDEVITSPNSFVATSNAAVYLGGRPVFVDIHKDTYCIDTEKIEERITSHTKAIAPVSFGGYPVNLMRIREIADKYDLKIVHDAAHAIGSNRGGSFGMEYADVAILSFHPVKHITTGEGGMVLTNDKDIYEKLLLFRSHGITKDEGLLTEHHGPWYYEMVSLGYNYRMSDIQAALGICQFERLQSNLVSRNHLAKYYEENLSKCEFLRLPLNVGFDASMDAGTIHAYHLYPVTLMNEKERRPFYDYLHSQGIMAQIHYIPIHLQPYYKNKYGYKKGDYPVAEQYYNTEVSVPMYHNMSEEDREYIVHTIWEYDKR